ncbi:MAG: AAA family ATPase [Deltaproteobacteria bacterium]|nr:AAA family ATPase [Deltaproteobacteria bacterium]
MIHQVRLVNFKSHRDTTIDLGPLTVLVGANASGKSSMLQATFIGALLARGRSMDDSLTSSLLQTWKPWRRGTQEFELEFLGQEKDPDYEWTWRSVCSQEKEEFWKYPEVLKVDGTQVAAETRRPVTSRGGCFARISADQVRAQSPVSAPLEQQFTGRYLASRMAELKLADDPAVGTIQAKLRAMVPSFIALRTRFDGNEKNPGYELLFDFEGAPGLTADSVSDGTLLALAVLTLVFSPNPPSVVLFDDIESGLHPTAQLQLIQYLKDIAGDGSKIQIIAASHSPYILSAVDPKYVYVTAIKDGVSHVKPLSQHPLAAKRLQVLDAGEFWSSEDESWVLAP